MSLRLQMLQVARLAPKVLGDSTGLVANFILRQQNPDGGFKDRKGKSDLYYTAFALDCLAALRQEIPREPVKSFLRSFADLEQLDFVHLCCLARCWAAVSDHRDAGFARTAGAIAGRLETFRSADGGFNTAPNQPSGAVYGAFLAFGAWQDLERELPFRPELIRCVRALQTPDGGWANDRRALSSATNATAAAIAFLAAVSEPVDPKAGDWLLSQVHPQGGFRASPVTPVPDLLSTATSLHALAALDRDVTGIREACLDFIDTLWTNEGSFHGHWGEDLLDTEYTYYGLLALGHLSL